MKLKTLKNKCHINIKEKKTGKIYEKFSKPVIYCPSIYKISKEYTGNGIKIAILDSGTPEHKDIKNIRDKINFCENNKCVYDKLGHSTALAGIINANNITTIRGFSPYSQLFFAKIVDDTGVCNFNLLVTGILWAIIKEVDIIVIALGSQYDYMILHDAIKKAYENNICVFASVGNNVKEMNYPAKYPEVFSVGTSTKKNVADFSLPKKSYYTTYLDNKYVKMSGSSISTSVVASLASLIIEKNKHLKQEKDFIKIIYSELSKFIN